MIEVRGDGTVYRPKGSRYWHIQYFTNGKRERESSGSTKWKDARDLLRTRLEEAESGIAPSNKTAATVADLYRALESDYVINGRKSLIDLRGRWQHHLKTFFGSLRPNRVRPAQVKAYIRQRQEEGAADASINRELAALKRMYKLAVEEEVLKFGEQPLIKLVRERNVRKGFLKDEEYERLAKETAAVGLWLRAAFEVGVSFGWRKREVLNLRVRQLDFAKRTINLNPGETKEDEGRIVGMTQKAWELLAACCSGKGADDYVFTRDKDHCGRKVRHQGRVVDFRDDWSRVCCAAEVGKMVCRAHGRELAGGECPECGKLPEASRKYIGLFFHDLRRTAVSNNAEVMDEKTAMLISGHKTRSVFDRYHIVSRRKLQDAAHRMEKAARERHERGRFAQAELFEGPEQDGQAADPPRKPTSTAPEERHRSVTVGQPSKLN